MKKFLIILVVLLAFTFYSIGNIFACGIPKTQSQSQNQGQSQTQ